MEGHQSSSQRSSPTDADHLQRITALTVNVGKISKSNSVQSSSANQRSAQNTTNSASSGSSDPILAMEKLVKSRIPNSSTSRSWKMSHWLWIIVLVQIAKVIMVLLIWPLLTSQCKCHILLKQKLCEHPNPWDGYQCKVHGSNIPIIWDLQLKPNQIVFWMFFLFRRGMFSSSISFWALAEAVCQTILREQISRNS